MPEAGRLYVCATPIGNLGDISERLGQTLRQVDVVYAEDTRRTGALLGHLGASPRVRSLFVGNEGARTDELLQALAEGQGVALVTDAGMPGVSDPGSEAVRRAREDGHVVSVVPGPSAVTSAIALAGFGADRFVFEGFLPRKGKDRAQRLRQLARDDRPTVLFVSPHRLLGDLESLSGVLAPDRRIAVIREMTKMHEEVWVGPISEALALWDGREAKGELTVVVSPSPAEQPQPEEAISLARARVLQGISKSDAAREVAEATGVARRLIYQALIDDQSVN